MDFNSLAVDGVSLSGALEPRLQALGDFGFRQAVLSAADLAGHPQGVAAAVAAVRRSGIEILALDELRDFEGLTGPSHDYKLRVAQGLLRLCRDAGARMLIVAASTVDGAGRDPEAVARDLGKLSTLAVPLGIRLAYRARPGSTVAPDLVRAAELVNAVNRANLGLAIDAGDLLASPAGLDDVDYCYPEQLFLVRLSDHVPLSADVDASGVAPRGVPVFPGEGARGALLIELVTRLRLLEYYGDFCLAARSEDHGLLPVAGLAERAAASRQWLQRHLRHSGLPRRRPVAAKPSGR
jgi:sugar phosphate isomerase/epimerase